MSKNKIREQKQKKAIQCWINNGCVGTIEADMGFGKGKIAVDAIYYKFKPGLRILFIGGINNSLSNNFKKELKEWNITPINDIHWQVGDLGYVSITDSAVQGIYKIKDQVYDLLIMDECHTCLTPKYSRVIKNNTFKSMLWLSGTPEYHKPEKKVLYDAYCPIIFVYKETIKDGVVNNTRILVLNRKLDNNFKTEAGNSKKSWMAGELAQYTWLNEQFTESKKDFYNSQGIKNLSFEKKPKLGTNAFKLMYDKTLSEEAKWHLRRYASAMGKRKKLLLTLKSNQVITRQIVNKILSNVDNKVFIFSELIDQVGSITNYTYHSDNKKDINIQALDDFNRGKIRELGSSKSLIHGINTTGLNYGILESYISSTTFSDQKAGRLNRLSVEDTATLVIIKILETQSEEWFNKMIVPLKETREVTEFNSLTKLLSNL